MALHVDRKPHFALFAEADRRTADGTTQLTAEDLMGWSKARDMVNQQGVDTQGDQDRSLSFELPDCLTLHFNMHLSSLAVCPCCELAALCSVIVICHAEWSGLHGLC